MSCLCGEVRKDRIVTAIARYEERSCTDVLFLILFFLSWIGIIIIFSRSISRGADVDRIIRPTDWLGRTCGKTEGVKDMRYGAWPNPLSYDFQICVVDCIETNTHPNMTYQYYTTEFVYYCIPSINGSVNFSVSLSGSFEDASNGASRVIGDLFTAWPVILVSGFVAFGMSYFWAWLCKKWASFMVLCAILFIIVGGFLIGYVFLDRAKAYENTEVSDRAKILKAFGVVCIICTVLFILAMFVLRERIRIAIAIVKAAADAINDMKMIVVFPSIPVLMGLAYMVWWIAVALHLMSVGTYEQEPIPDRVRYRATDILKQNPLYPVNYTTFHWDQQLKNSFALHFFHLLWNVEFLIYFTYLVSAGAIANWYFTPYDENGIKPRGRGDRELTPTPVTESLMRTIRFHLGTICLGSLIIAIIQFTRYVIKYLEEKSHRINGEPNQLQRYLFCCLQCCLKCVECCMDKINKSAFVWTAVYGDGFATAACSSFQLIWNNLLRVAAITVVSTYLMILGKLVVALLTTGLAALFLGNYPYFQLRLSSIIMPCTIIFIISFLVASLFMAVFETTIDTTFMCFLIDESCNKGGNMLASKELVGVIDGFADVNKREHDRQHSVRRYRSGRLQGKSVREIQSNNVPPSANSGPTFA